MKLMKLLQKLNILVSLITYDGNLYSKDLTVGAGGWVKKIKQSILKYSEILFYICQIGKDLKK